MFVFLISLALLYLSFSNGNTLKDALEERDVYHTLFGNIGSMKDLILKESNGTAPDDMLAADDNDTLDEPDLEIADVFGFLQTNLTNQAFDLHDFININDQYSNFTKEYKNKSMNEVKNNTRRQFYYDVMEDAQNYAKKLANDLAQNAQDLALEAWRQIEWRWTSTSTLKPLSHERTRYIDPDDQDLNQDNEEVKRQQLRMVLVQFTMHCRYEVAKALAQRDFVRNDKRYKLGYLFNRMRRLKNNQLKIIGMGYHQEKAWYRHMFTLMRMYESVMHLDVDMRDTANLIKEVYKEEAPYDFLNVTNN